MDTRWRRLEALRMLGASLVLPPRLAIFTEPSTRPARFRGAFPQWTAVFWQPGR